mmetsp:Transcript_19515/g.36550  ORF Transcript_19515/g.36550 Transcript_19515/m.36550 type:complete len:249 (+) Transcript_19515:2634-3380(+)
MGSDGVEGQAGGVIVGGVVRVVVVVPRAFSRASSSFLAACWRPLLLLRLIWLLRLPALLRPRRDGRPHLLPDRPLRVLVPVNRYGRHVGSGEDADSGLLDHLALQVRQCPSVLGGRRGVGPSVGRRRRLLLVRLVLSSAPGRGVVRFPRLLGRRRLFRGVSSGREDAPRRLLPPPVGRGWGRRRRSPAAAADEGIERLLVVPLVLSVLLHLLHLFAPRPLSRYIVSICGQWVFLLFHRHDKERDPNRE